MHKYRPKKATTYSKWQTFVNSFPVAQTWSKSSSSYKSWSLLPCSLDHPTASRLQVVEKRASKALAVGGLFLVPCHQGLASKAGCCRFSCCHGRITSHVTVRTGGSFIILHATLIFLWRDTNTAACPIIIRCLQLIWVNRTTKTWPSLA